MPDPIVCQVLVILNPLAKNLDLKARGWTEYDAAETRVTQKRVTCQGREMRLDRFPNQEVGHAFEIRVVGCDASEAVMPHDGKIEGIVGEKTVCLFDVVAVTDVRSFERKDLDTDSLNGLRRREMLDKFLDVRRAVLEVADSCLGLEMKRAEGFDNHQAMKGFSQNQCGSEAEELGVLNALQEVGAVVGEFSGAGEMVDENVGVNEDVRAVRKVYRHGGV
jgi:hypothetical protein